MSTQTITAAPPGVSATQRVALRCAGLVKRFVDVTAVNGLDLEVYAGECLAYSVQMAPVKQPPSRFWKA